MKLGILVSLGCTALSTIATTNLVMAQESRPATVEPQQNDNRSAIARVNPNKPIQIRVVSQGTIPVVATVLPLAGDRLVAPGKTVIFGRLHTSYLSLPMDLQVSLQETPDPNNPIRVFLDVKTSGNEIIVYVKTSTASGGNSSQTVSVDPKGAIYVF